ncbi:hypothetical protein EDB89DRAFT_119961 [Lactarius sanguifluus]|nr:hypothetical protein EDB89DRAFT_119961 [Lactarius sanguifluus]
MSDYATFPTEAQNGGQGFVEHAKNIGRAYQHQAMELIYICQLLSRVSPPRIAREDAELRRTLRVCDIALRSAADSGKGVTDEANTCFEEATQVLCKYSKRFYPDDPTDFVEVTMGRAKRKDSARKAWSYEQFEDEWRSTTSTNFVLLRSPLANLHDPENIIVRRKG